MASLYSVVEKTLQIFLFWKDEAGFISISLDAPKVRLCTQRFSKEIIKFCYIISSFVSVPLTERKICKGFSFFSSSGNILLGQS